jgi:hypothetical protein
MVLTTLPTLYKTNSDPGAEALRTCHSGGSAMLSIGIHHPFACTIKQCILIEEVPMGRPNLPSKEHGNEFVSPQVPAAPEKWRTLRHPMIAASLAPRRT